MEIVGKILSLTLLTIFGSAAATVYLIDSDFISSVFDQQPAAIYGSESVDSDNQYVSLDKNYRKRQRGDFFEVQGSKQQNKKGKDNTTVWSNDYSKSVQLPYSPNTDKLAQFNSTHELMRKMRYWKDEYDRALRSGQNQNAQDAYEKYMDYKEAIEIKQN